MLFWRVMRTAIRDADLWSESDFSGRNRLECRFFDDGMKYKNVIGPQVRRLRSMRSWTQEKLAIELQITGWEKISRSGVSKIEGGIVWVSDFEMLYLAAALRVNVDDLLPKLAPTEELDTAVTRMLSVRY